MNSRRTFQLAIIGILSIFLISTSWASTGGRTVVLESTVKHPDASGTAVIDQDHVSLKNRLNLIP
jgi:hypothetical protein